MACKNSVDIQPEVGPEVKKVSVSPRSISPLEKTFIENGLSNVGLEIPEIDIDLKYSTTDNFLHKDVYGDLDQAYLQPDVLIKLKQAYNYLQKKDSSLTFVIYDASRPLSVQKKMWKILEMPLDEKGKYLSNPARGSVHNYGAAVDISLIYKNGQALDMGTPFDYFGELAEPQLENKMLNEGKLTTQQINNRKILREVMQKSGFRQMPTEWWHYNSCSREQAKMKYKIIE
ncbi:MAG: M15 family metallopeptidase [Chitinophagales bacterium]